MATTRNASTSGLLNIADLLSDKLSHKLYQEEIYEGSKLDFSNVAIQRSLLGGVAKIPVGEFTLSVAIAKDCPTDMSKCELMVRTYKEEDPITKKPRVTSIFRAKQ